jgi:glycosyltransferase involved in cell wall biosynthesis
VSNLRVYIAIHNFLPQVGGAEKQALMHGSSLRARGFVTTILTLRHKKSWLAHEVIEGVPVIRVAGALLDDRDKLPDPLKKICYMTALLVMSWTLWQHRHRYDAIHLFHLGLEALPIALVCRFTGKPLIISVRNADAGQSARVPAGNQQPGGPLAASTARLRLDQHDRREGDLAVLESLGKPVVRFTCSLLQHISAVVVVLSSRMHGYLAAHDFRLSHIQLIPNGVDTLRFHPLGAPATKEAAHTGSPLTSGASMHAGRQQALVDGSQTIVCVSKLRYQKGIDILLQAWYLVHQQAPQARLIVVGDGPLHHQLEQMAEALGMAESVEFAGLQSDIPAQFQRGDVAVLPSYWEGMPNAVLEAMACGLPCVATRVSGSEDIITDGVNGLLVEPADYEGMARALLHLLGNPALVQQYGAAARATIERQYSLERVTDMYIELYQRIVSAAAPQSGKDVDLCVE